MNSKKAIVIMDVVEGDELEDGLSTIGVALIHLCSHHGIAKDHMLDAMSAQWDLYQRQKKAADVRNEHKAKMN